MTALAASQLCFLLKKADAKPSWKLLPKVCILPEQAGHRLRAELALYTT
jgi:hypothetical protein